MALHIYCREREGGTSIKHTKRINIAYKQTKWARESCKRFNFVKGCDGCINLVKL